MKEADFTGFFSVIALAGRRIDAENATQPRFPLERADAVRKKLDTLFRHTAARALVCSAACGADLLALEAARDLGMPFRIVLPFDKKTFRETSVVDRPGDWGPRYDRICAAARERDDLIEMNLDPENGQEAYKKATLRILDEATAVAAVKADHLIAVSVSDGVSRGAGDLTEYFVTEARGRKIDVEAVATLDQSA